MSFLGLEGLHCFITGAAGGIGGQAVKEFLGKPYKGFYLYIELIFSLPIRQIAIVHKCLYL
jgi:hypothetical protein